jgi:flagellar biogenesis protein FliO
MMFAHEEVASSGFLDKLGAFVQRPIVAILLATFLALLLMALALYLLQRFTNWKLTNLNGGN